jgi:hypothetical protein
MYRVVTSEQAAACLLLHATASVRGLYKLNSVDPLP